jgi:hypothetical protein
MKTLSIITTLFCFSIWVSAQIIHIPDDYSAIQQGIDASATGDTVLVAQGEYFENINFKGRNIAVCSNYVFSGDTQDIENTIINGSNPVDPDTASCVLIVSGENSSAVLQGFTLTGGSGTLWEDEHGPGQFYTEGGGILIQASSPVIKNNIISGNEAINIPVGATSAGGGAIRCGDGNPQILNNIITFNQGRYGGGIVLNYSGAVIKNNIIAYNTGGQDFGGGGLWCLLNGANPVIIENNTISANHSALGGGGVRLWSTVATITNNIIWGNTAANNPQIQGNSGNVTYCCIENGYNGTGNINVNPQFVTGNFILDDNSDCVDAGSPDAAYNDPEDPDNAGFALYPAKGLLISDIGVYGGPGCLELPQILTSINETQNKQEQKVCLLQNPINNQIIHLKSMSVEDLHFSFFLLDVQGKMLFANSMDLVAEESLKIPVSGIGAGVYILRIVYSGGRFETMKLVIQ